MLYRRGSAAVNPEGARALRARCASAAGARRKAASGPLNPRAPRADSFPMRLRLFAVLLVAFLASGCFVFDELDKGNKILDNNFSHHAGEQAKDKEPATANAKGGKPNPDDPKEKAKSWWQSAHTLSRADEKPSKDPNVKCDIGGKVRFSRQSNCVSQGGKVLL